METWELIHQYHLERQEEQIAMEAASHGLLTVRVQFVEDLLRIEILNARNLHPMDISGKCVFIKPITYLLTPWSRVLLEKLTSCRS
jgi:hypothetical protein